MSKSLLPGATLGVMGGGQLGRMFVQAAQSMGYFTAVLDPDPTSPAGMVAHYHIDTDYLDEQGLAQLMQRCDGITIEFENVPSPALVTLGAHRPTSPDADALGVCQDRALEKAHFKRCGVACAPHAVIANEAQLAAVPAALFPAILKTSRMGYDGKGQVGVADLAALPAAWAALGGAACVLEQRLPLAHEISVVIARSAMGVVVGLPVQQNLHRDGILAVTEVPAPDVPEATRQQAFEAAARVADSLNYVGVLCVEFFVLDDGRLVANEMAPRPHNSGHHSIDSCDVSQFELQVRALTGLPLVAPRQHSAAVMLNLLGDLWFARGDVPRAPDWAAVLALPGVHLHLYGKTGARRGRKMGHLTVTADQPAQARDVARQAAALLGIDPGLVGSAA
ncbi:5-(carboxyamino)imidazole ribonucleotide synthase [Ideonella sp. A 288]|uniref:5-(carboxyamino)imidazole ribonucleotide synthase n=1 Tax=Ideonella sp. A 288 TaxID=1962181 RepID=UPI000B4ACBBA|nr:5-(carboxyamino)imidazole ribonucleotide synthase [Ideonella sp. A 288]